MRVAFFNYSKLREWDEGENSKDLMDCEIDRISRGFGDEGVERC